jgi:hypothetical protein
MVFISPDQELVRFTTTTTTDFKNKTQLTVNEREN